MALTNQGIQAVVNSFSRSLDGEIGFYLQACISGINDIYSKTTSDPNFDA